MTVRFLAKKKEKTLLSVYVLSTKLLIGDTILTSPSGDGPAILRVIIIIIIIITIIIIIIIIIIIVIIITITIAFN